MKVLIFATKFHPFKGGLEQFVLELATRLNKEGIRADVATFNLGDWKQEDKLGQIKIYRFDCWKVLPGVYSLPRRTKKNKELWKKIKQEKYDYVITNTRFFFSSYMGARFAKRNKIRHLHIEHGNVLPKLNNPLVWLLDRTYEYSLGRGIFKNAWKVVGISEPCRDFAIKMGADPKKTFMIHNSIDARKFRPLRRKRHSGFVITYVGRLIYAKGIRDLICAVEGQDIRLNIVGDGPFRQELEKLSQEKGIKTKFFGAQPLDNVIEILRGSDLFVNPSYSEGLPTSILEAGALGLPVIATDVGGTKEIIIDSSKGWLFKPKDIKSLRRTIESVLHDQKKADRKGRELRKYILKNFDWDINIKKFIRLLR
ncbi:MAG: glycosyltransferase family 4 protein [Nanoarchaeota archaeon]|nr:glycosyltransferase family 4 protein [Nanoarchaeota archaeon]